MSTRERDDPAPVEVTNTEPLPVMVAARERESDTDSPAQSDARKALASAKVNADTARTDDQRRISGIWERTQQVIALAVVIPTVGVAAVLCVMVALRPDSSGEMRALAITAFTLLATLTGSVIGFYFGRTNHQRVGGVATGDEANVGR